MSPVWLVGHWSGSDTPRSARSRALSWYPSLLLEENAFWSLLLLMGTLTPQRIDRRTFADLCPVVIWMRKLWSCSCLFGVKGGMQSPGNQTPHKQHSSSYCLRIKALEYIEDLDDKISLPNSGMCLKLVAKLSPSQH